MQENLKKQSFKSEAEEAQWWDENQDDLAQEFEKAAAEGTLGRGTVARKGKTPTTTIRLDPEDISRARAQAELKGLRYQTYLKMLIHESLRQAELQPSPGVQDREKNLAKKRLFVEQRPQGDYAVRKPDSDRAIAVLPTQAEAIERARELNPGTPPLVERVRRTTVGKPDKWRKP
jgi:predicted DNA binding CopG/RHH family protein